MSLTIRQKSEIKNYLKKVIEDKLNKYKPETQSMPFHYRLLGKKRYITFSFIQSINTTFGMSIFEQLGTLIAKNFHREAKNHYQLLGNIDENIKNQIEKLHYSIRTGLREPDKQRELKVIKELSQETDDPKKDPDSIVDLYVKDKKGIEHFFDITSAKPNMKEFVELKRKLIKWSALKYSVDPDSKIITQLAIPYNPYEPEEYNRWTLKGLYDLKNKEILIGKDFWNFLGGQGTFEDLLDIFDKTGKELDKKIEAKIINLGQ